MTRNIDILKGISPGKILDRELRRRSLSQRAFAAAIGEHSQNINAIITGRRRMTTAQALKIEAALGLEEGFLLTLQVYYDIACYKRYQASRSVSGRPNIRRVLFWDTDFDNLDFGLYKSAVIARVMEKGNEEEKSEIARFYGMDRQALEKFRPTNPYRMNPSVGQDRKH